MLGLIFITLVKQYLYIDGNYKRRVKGRILLISLKDILENIALGKIVYTLYLKEY